MQTEPPIASPSTPRIALVDSPGPDDTQASSRDPMQRVTWKQCPAVAHLWLSPDFAELQASNILLVMGIVVFCLGLVGCAAFVVGHGPIAALFVVLGLLTVTFSARLGWLVLLKVHCHLGGALAKFGLENANENDPGLDGFLDV